MNELQKSDRHFYNEVPVLTTKELAEYYGVDETTITKNFNNNRNNYIENIDYFLLKGNALKEFKRYIQNLYEAYKFAPELYLWTESGCLKHAKSIGTPKAWEVYGMLIKSYFTFKETKQIEKPKDLASLLIEAGEELRKKDIIIREKETKLIEANTQIEKAQPKLEVYETFMTSNGTMSMNDLAKTLFKEFKIGRNTLFAILRGHHILLANNTPYQKYIDAGYFQVVTRTIKRETHDDLLIPQTFVTPKGAKYIRNLLKESQQEKAV